MNRRLQRETETKIPAFRPNPARATHVELVKVLLVSVLGLYIGASVSRRMASFLEENDLFVPDDDDDD